MEVRIPGLTATQTEHIVRSAAERAGVAIAFDTRAIGTRFRFRLVPHHMHRERFRRLSPQTGRRVNAVCYHGHRAFMRAIYAMSAHARIRTALATYTGERHFETTHAQQCADSRAFAVFECSHGDD